ncbi:ATP-binding protein [Streptomyces sp. NBC_01571]|uniref:DnaB-like helicase C-terminal domain-containing protein n=1 Tax=Streptomyces sp. NBC_01571 TaxID=2975883 RepID=UPI00224C8E3B|nr:DnaB-like helicase C-terminal domain-containing protein [Streptomyces sp. NBC_01571]MCX4581172.1 ATP-binding protein [Streptomyces sp. NBC_01571]
MNASDARRDLYALVKRANDDGVTTLIHRGSKQEDRVLLAPLDRFPAARKVGAFPSWVLSAAQKEFGTLVSRAASGQPQVLRRSSTPVAVLLPADGPIHSSPSDPAAPAAATAGGAVTSQPTPSRDAGRRLATLGDALGDVITSGSVPGLSFGLAGLDAATGGLHPGRLVLVAAPPQVGGSLIGLGAARHTALALNSRVLYAASGPNRADITRRIIAAEAGGDYARLKTGTLTPHEQEVVQQLRNAPLLIDDGSDLTAEAIAETVPVAGELALVVVDRLQRARNPRLPLSGEHLPAASQVLRELARTQHVPVLAVVDTDDPAIVNLLDADVILTLTALPDTGETDVTVAERDLGVIGHARLRPDLAHARFLDTPTTAGTTAAAGVRAGGDMVSATVGSDTDRELAAAALPFTSGAFQGLPAEATHLLAALRTALAAGNIKDLDELRVPLRALAAAGLQLPGNAEGRSLAAALHAYNAPAPASTPAPTPAAAPAPASAVAPVAEDSDEAERDDDDGLVEGDEEDEPEGAVFPALRILKDSVERSKMHPVPVIRKDDRDGGPWPLISEDMDGEPRWVHPDVTSTRVAHERNGKRVRRDQLDVPASFGDGLMCLIDRNGSFPSACSAVPLAPNRLLHTGPLEAFDKSKAGIYLIEIPAWMRTDMPHPLGRLIDRPDEQGRVWVTTPHLKQLERLYRDGHFAEPVVIHDSWTGKINESLFKPFYEAARAARTDLIKVGGEPYKNYKTRLSIALRLLWPKRPDSRSPFWRPDWRMSMVAEASVRHWTVAFKAVQAGHTLIALRNVDAAIFWTPDETPPDTYRIGTGFGEVKAKFIQPGTFIPEGDD